MQTKYNAKYDKRKTITKVEVHMSIVVYIRKDAHIQKNMKFQ